jgi:class 3 adenylate cyclase
MAEVETARAKYIFLDVVGFTRDRSVEAQTYIVETMNAIVHEVLAHANIADDRRLLIPTGDGVCIALLNIDSPYDVEIQMALMILRCIQERNESCADATRRFEVRIGVNENIDNVVIDVNGHRNMAGAGISMAARVMDCADGGQILVSQMVHDRLKSRERYMRAFTGFRAVAKHRNAFLVFQYLLDGVNTAVPEALRAPEAKRAKMPLNVAFYIVESYLNRSSLMDHKDITESFTITGLLWLRALDAADAYEAEAIESPRKRLTDSGATFDDQFRRFRNYPAEIMLEFATEISRVHLAPFKHIFEDANAYPGPRFANEDSVVALRHEWPDIAMLVDR